MTGKTWLVTGCATGFGRQIAEHALARGDRVAVTDRSLVSVEDFALRYPDTALPLGLDVTNSGQIAAAVEAAFAHFGRIDVLVNNAGYAVQQAVEEADLAALRAMYDVNLFGMIEVVRAALPGLRAQGGGHIINFASVAGRVSAPFMALYASSKFAVEGLSEGLAGELAGFGIKVTVVEPGAFATGFGAAVQPPANPMSAYEPLREGMRKHIEHLVQGDPADLAAAILALADSPNPPLRFVGGADAYGMIEANLQAQQAEMAQWRALSDEANKVVLQPG